VDATDMSGEHDVHPEERIGGGGSSSVALLQRSEVQVADVVGVLGRSTNRMSAGRTLPVRYWVRPSSDRWTVAVEEQVLARYPDRPSATVAAVALARIDLPAELLITDENGVISEQRVLGPEPEDPERTMTCPTAASACDAERFAITERSAQQVTLSVAGDLAHDAWLVQLTRMILDTLDDPQLKTIVVDMSDVTDFDVACVAGWVGLEHHVCDRGRSLRIVNASQVVHAVLERMELGHEHDSDA
jgi:ABC-type transporter Mla MlaB component